MRARSRRDRPSMSIRDFQLGREIGKGFFGTVFAAHHIETNVEVAVKIMKKADIVRRNHVGQIRSEIEILSRLRHPNILRFYCYFYDQRWLYVVSELAKGGDLYSYMKRHEDKILPSQEVSQIVRQIGLALQEMHKQDVAHRDIKPENVVLDEHGNAKLCDFGYSIDTSFSRRKTRCGTLDYLSPEIVGGSIQRYYNAKEVDMWTLGVLTYEMLTGGPPFYDEDEDRTRRRIRDVDVDFPESVPSVARRFVLGLLKRTGGRRMKIDEALLHPFLEGRSRM